MELFGFLLGGEGVVDALEGDWWVWWRNGLVWRW